MAREMGNCSSENEFTMTAYENVVNEYKNEAWKCMCTFAHAVVLIGIYSLLSYANVNQSKSTEIDEATSM